jgi:Asp-tRNA(Asn)/Glu-tRNA(Gln) amidotransferase A subunit family amidase
MQPWQLGAADVVRAVARGELSVTELVTSLLDRIGQLNPTYRAWVTVDAGPALAVAQELGARPRDAQLREGHPALTGLPMGFKDVIQTAGLRTTASSKALTDFVPEQDAAVVASLRAAGALVLGKLETCEFANADPSVTLNPWNPACTPGGSSSGSAVAVALGLVPASLGTQTGGSTLRPAAYNGVVGFKPTYGRISNDGVIPLAWSLDHIGFFGRSVADVEIVFESLVPGKAGEQGPAGRKPRLAIVRSPLFDSATPESAASLARVAGQLAEAGAEVRETRDPGLLEPLRGISPTVIAAEAATYHREQYARVGHLYGPKISATVERGLRIPAHEYVAAQRQRAVLVQALEEWAAGTEADALLMLTVPGPAPADLAATGDPAYLSPWTTAGFPAISIPTAISADGLPLAAQLVGRRGCDWRLLETARWAESVIGFAARPPAWFAVPPGEETN